MLEGINPVEISTYYGLNTKLSRGKLEPGFSPDTDSFHDIDLSQPGVAKTRGGSFSINQSFGEYSPDSYTKLLLHMDGANGSTSFIDSSASAHTVVRSAYNGGNLPVISTATYKFGGASGLLDGDNASPFLGGKQSFLLIADSDDFDFSGGVWTVDFWVNFNALAILQGIFSHGLHASNAMIAQAGADGKIYFSGNSISLATSTSLSAGVWNHVAIVENGNDFYIFINGVQGEHQNTATRLPNYATDFLIGEYGGSAFSANLNGYIDEFRISKGIARWTSNFTPSVNPHPNSFPLPFMPRRIHDYFKPSSNTHTMMVNGGVYVDTISVLGEATVVGSEYTDGETMDFLNYKDDVYYSNGVDPGHVFDGTSERLWGIVAPGSPPTFDVDALGPLTGDYQYSYTYYSSVTGAESSSASVFSDIHTVVNATINLKDLIASTDPQVDKIRIYRTTAGGALLLLLATINNGTTTYADSILDENLGTIELPIYNDPPGLFVGIEEWDGRIFGFEKNSTRVAWSNDEFLTPAGNGIPWESFGADNFIDFNYKVFGIKKSPNFNEIWVHTSGGIYAITRTGIAEDPYDAQIRNSTWFTISHYSITNIYNDQWFLTSTGKWMSLDSSGYLTYESYTIEPTMALANKTRYKTVQAVHYQAGAKNQFRAVYADEASQTFTKMIAANYLQRTPYDENSLRHPVWEYHNIPSTCIGIVKNSDEENVLYTGTTDGRIVRQDIGTNDDGEAIDWSMSIGWLRSSVTVDKTAFPRFVVTYFKPLGDWFFSLRTDFDFGISGGQVYQIKTVSEGDKFDIDFIFDTSVFAGEQDLIRKTTNLGGEYKYAELTWYGNTVDQTFEMHSNTLLSKEVEGFRR